MENFDEQNIIKDLKNEARALGIPIGAAESFINLVVPAVIKNLSDKKIITEKDLTRAVIRELKKYNADLAYVYENRDKII